MVFPTGQSKINVYCCLGIYYLFLYSILKSSAYWLKPNMDINIYFFV